MTPLINVADYLASDEMKVYTGSNTVYPEIIAALQDDWPGERMNQLSPSIAGYPDKQEAVISLWNRDELDSIILILGDRQIMLNVGPEEEVGITQDIVKI